VDAATKDLKIGMKKRNAKIIVSVHNLLVTQRRPGCPRMKVAGERTKTVEGVFGGKGNDGIPRGVLDPPKRAERTSLGLMKK